MSANLDAPALVGGQTNPETTVNDAIGRLDAAMTELLVVDVSSDVTLTATQFRTAFKFSATPVGSGKKLTIPSVQRMFYVFNDGVNDLILKKGTTEITIEADSGGFYYTDGGTNSLEALAASGGGGGGGGGGGTTVPSDLATYVIGTPLADQVLLRFKCVRPFSWPASLAGSQFSAGVAATASYTVTIKNNGSSIGTLDWSAAGTIPAITFASQVDFVAGDVITIEAPTTPDTTIAQIALDFLGTRDNDTGLQPADLSLFVPGKPGNGAVILRFKCVREFVWGASLTGSYFSAGTTSALTATFTIKQNGSSIGTITFSTSATGTATFASTVFFAVGDVITIEAPGTQDGTLADVAFNILGSR